MTSIKELFPRPNISVNEKAIRPLIYGFNCLYFENDEYKDVCVFIDPDTYSTINIYNKKTGSLFRRFSIFEIKSVRYT